MLIRFVYTALIFLGMPLFFQACKTDDAPLQEKKEVKVDGDDVKVANSSNYDEAMEAKLQEDKQELKKLDGVKEGIADLVMKKFDEDADGLLSKEELGGLLKVSKFLSCKQSKGKHGKKGGFKNGEWGLLKEKLAWCKANPEEKPEYCEKMFQKWETMTSEKESKGINVLDWCKENPDKKPEYCAEVLQNSQTN